MPLFAQQGSEAIAQVLKLMPGCFLEYTLIPCDIEEVSRRHQVRPAVGCLFLVQLCGFVKQRECWSVGSEPLSGYACLPICRCHARKPEVARGKLQVPARDGPLRRHACRVVEKVLWRLFEITLSKVLPSRSARRSVRERMAASFAVEVERTMMDGS